MRASSWASTTTRRARSVNRSNMRISPESIWWGYGYSNPTDSLRVPRSPPNQSESAHSEQPRTGPDRCGAARAASVGGVVRRTHVRGDPTAVRHVEAVVARPVADLPGAGAGVPSGGLAGTGTARRRPDLAAVPN